MASARIRNASASPFHGWLRINVEMPPPSPADAHELTRDAFLLPTGETVLAVDQVGYDLVACDVLCKLGQGELRKLDIAQDGIKVEQPTPVLPGNALQFFGVPAVLLGEAELPFTLVHAYPSGAAIDVRLRLRAPGINFDVDLLWYPDQPGVSQGELRVTASDPRRAELTFAIPHDLRLRIGAFTQILGLPVDAPFLRAGDWLGDGQCRAFPFVAVWPQHLKTIEDFHTATALAQWAVGGHGIDKLYPCGSPFPLDPVAFFRAHWTECVQALHRWENPSIGVAANSSQSGSQEDQVFVGGECRDALAELPRYLAALAQLRRPCHHLEADGELLRLAEHEDLMLWDSRPLWISRDQLGKPRALTQAEAHGWWGGDVEHWLLNTINVAARLRYSPTLQWGLEAQARVYLKQWTVDPALSTSQPYASRAVGWECLAAVQLFRNLRNRELAAQVLARFVQRLELIILPQLRMAANNVWDVRWSDPRLGDGPRYIAWQQAVEAGLMDIAGEFLAEHINRALGTSMRELALAGALRILDWSWRLDEATGNWQSNPSGQSANDGSGGEWGDSFDFFGMSLAPAVILRQRENADDASVRKASGIWRELLRNNPRSSWLVPGVSVG